jgi:hypothetical protein
MQSGSLSDRHEHGWWRYGRWIMLAAVFLFLVSALAAGIYFALVVAVILLVVFFDVDSRIPYSIALTLIAVSALFEALSHQAAANGLASLAYYALAAGVAVQLYHYLRDKPLGEKDETD